MPPMANKRSMMIFYSDPLDHYCHQVRIVLAEKGVSFEVVTVTEDNKPEELVDLNPYNTVPVLVDRDLVLYEPRIIMEYLDERFPHPPLLPVYPVARAKYRLMMHRVERDWFCLVDAIESGDEAKAEPARKELRESILTLAPAFEEKPFFFSDTFSLIDCCLAPLFWRLPKYGIEIPANAKSILAYQDRLFELESFKASLTEEEKELRSFF